MAKKKAYYNNDELADMILEGSINEALEILNKQIPKGQNKTLFTSTRLHYDNRICKVDARIMNACKSILDFKDLSRKRLSASVIETLFDHLDIRTICDNENGLLDNLKFFDTVKDKVNFPVLCRGRKLSHEFIDRYRDSIDWNALVCNPNTTIETVIRYIKYIDVELALKNLTSGYNKTIEIKDIKKLIGLNLDNLEIVIKNHNLCTSELLEEYVDWIRENEELCFLILSKTRSTHEYNNFIINNKELFNTEAIFTRTNRNGYLHYVNLNKELIEFFYEPELFPELVIDILRKFHNYNSNFLDKFESVIENVGLAETISYQYNLSMRMINKCISVFKQSGRQTTRIPSIIRANNVGIVTDLDMAKGAVINLNWTVHEFKKYQKVLSEHQSYSYGNRELFTLKEIFEIFGNFYENNNISIEDSLRMTNTYLGYNCRLRTEEDQEQFREFIKQYVLIFNKFPSNLLTSYRSNNTTKAISKEFIINCLSRGVEFDSISFIFSDYGFNLEDLNEIIDKPVHDSNKEYIFQGYCERYPISLELFKKLFNNNYIRSNSSLYRLVDLPKNSLIDKDYLDFLVDNMNFEREKDRYYLNRLCADIWKSNSPLTYMDLTAYMNDNGIRNLDCLRNSIHMEKDYIIEGNLSKYRELVDSSFPKKDGYFKGYATLSNRQKKIKDIVIDEDVLNPNSAISFEVTEDIVYNNYGYNSNIKVLVAKEDVFGVMINDNNNTLMTRKIIKYNVEK